MMCAICYCYNAFQLKKLFCPCAVACVCVCVCSGTNASCRSNALHVRPHMTNLPTNNRCILPVKFENVFDNLREFAAAVEILTVYARSVSQLSSLVDSHVTGILQSVTRRLDFHLLSQHTFPTCLGLAQLLILSGRVAEVSLLWSNLEFAHVAELFKVFSSRQVRASTDLCDANSADASETTDADFVVAGDEPGEDLFDDALMPSGYSAEIGLLHMSNVSIGLQALSLLNCKFGGTDFEEIICSSLRSWNALKKFAVVGTTGERSRFFLLPLYRVDGFSSWTFYWPFITFICDLGKMNLVMNTHCRIRSADW
jgi:hypothetical protein